MSSWRVFRDVRGWLSTPKRPPFHEKPVIGLALGGGFARGLAHIGVLKVLEENNIPIHAGFSCAVPVLVLARIGATHIIAVHLICNPFPSAIPTNIFQMVGQCFALLQSRTGAEWRRWATCIIEPPVAGQAWDAFEAAP